MSPCVKRRTPSAPGPRIVLSLWREETERLLAVPALPLDIKEEAPGDSDRPLLNGGRRWGVGEADGDAKEWGDRENGLSRK